MSRYPSYRRVAFADKLYDICRDLFNMSHKDRRLLQDVGTAMKSVRNSVWIDYLMQSVNNNNTATSTSIDVIVDDGRYKDELTAMKLNGFILIRLKVDESIQLRRLMMLYPLDCMDHWSRRFHSSETDLDDVPDSYFDYVFDSGVNSIDQIVDALGMM
jgi:hypothetical protein